ncbi:MAG: hypothetical protein ACJAYX_004757 [Planctomycetota bacterium]
MRWAEQLAERGGDAVAVVSISSDSNNQYLSTSHQVD